MAKKEAQPKDKQQGKSKAGKTPKADKGAKAGKTPKADKTAKAGKAAKGEKGKAAPREPVPIPNLKQHYDAEVLGQLRKRFGYQNTHQVPRLKKIVLNMGVGDALQNPRFLDAAAEDLGQQLAESPARGIALRRTFEDANGLHRPFVPVERLGPHQQGFRQLRVSGVESLRRTEGISGHLALQRSLGIQRVSAGSGQVMLPPPDSSRQTDQTQRYDGYAKNNCQAVLAQLLAEDVEAARPPGEDRLAFEVAADVVGHLCGGLVATSLLLLQGLEHDRLQLPIHPV